MVIKADSPAGFAEQYIVESIWNGVFSPGTILPAERELSEMIGVTRTTLREVLQRLSRDGWLTIRHGKPTKVNDFWDTSSLNVLSTLVKLDQVDMHLLAEQVLKARHQISRVYWSEAIKNDANEVFKAITNFEDISDETFEYIDFENSLERKIVSISDNLVYLLILNGFEPVYKRLLAYLFKKESGKVLLRQFYQSVLKSIELEKTEDIIVDIDDYHKCLCDLWDKYKEEAVKAIKA